MGESITVFVGCDVGDKFTDVCILDQHGAVVQNTRVRTTRRSLERHLAGLGRARVVLEVGTHSRWIAAALAEAGHEVVVANARQVQLIWKRPRKTDQSDARLLARMGRVDVALLSPVHHRSYEAHADLACLRARDQLVGARTKLVNHVRGALKPFGLRVQDCSTQAFADAAQELLPAELFAALGPMLEVIRLLNAQIAAHDKQIEQLATAVYPESKRCTQIFGVGNLTALAFMLTLDDPSRFKNSRFAAAFLGLTPGKDQSGDSDPQKGITKAGDPFTRKLLVECAHRILSPVGGLESDLRKWGLKLAERGGRNGKKRATVAVARKLAVLMHRLWLTGEKYRPTGYTPTRVWAT
jgi:transposase